MYAYNANNCEETVSNTLHEAMLNESNMDDTNITIYGHNLVREYQELQEELLQKENDIKLLVKNELLLNNDIKNTQMDLGTSKLELLTEQDNYDLIEKKLNEETEFISATAEGQAILSNLTKFYMDQMFRTIQFGENYDKEVNIVNRTNEDILDTYKNYINEQTFLLNSIFQKNIETNNKYLPIIEKIQHLADKLKSAFIGIEKLFQTLNMEHHKQNAVLGYLENKYDEFITENNELKRNLEDTTGQNQELQTKEKACIELQLQVKILNENISKIKETFTVDHVYLGQLLDDKNINKDLRKLQDMETELMCKFDSTNSTFSSTENDNEKLKDILNSKCHLTVELDELKECLRVLEKEQTVLTNITKNNNIFKEEALEACNTLEKDLEALLQQQVLVNDIKNNLNLKKAELQNTYEERKSFCSNEIYLMMKDTDLLTEEKCSLEQEMEKCKTELEFNVKAVGDYSDQIQQMKCRLHDNTVRIDNLQDEIQISERSANEKQNKFSLDLSELQNIVSVKYNLKVEAEVEIERLNSLHSKIAELVEECEALHLIQQSDMNQLKESFMLELQDKRNELEYRKNELECLHKEKMSEVTDLNGDIIEAARNEIYLMKMTQELAHVNESRKKEISILNSAITTLDSKLLTIAKTVSNLTQESKGSTNQSEMKPPMSSEISKSTGKLDDSSSSGESMCAKDKTWRKKIIKKQQQKRANASRSQKTEH